MALTPEQLALLDVNGDGTFNTNDVAEALSKGAISESQAAHLRFMDKNEDQQYSQAELGSIAINPNIVEFLNRAHLSGMAFDSDQRAALLGRVAAMSMQTEVSGALNVAYNGEAPNISVDRSGGRNVGGIA